MSVQHNATLYGGVASSKTSCATVGVGLGLGGYCLLGTTLAWDLADQVYHNCMDQMSNATPDVHKQHCISSSHETLGLTLGLIYGLGCLVLGAAVGTACCIIRRYRVVKKEEYVSL